MTESDGWTIMFTGVTGMGKSAAANFFFKDKGFPTSDGMLRVTTKCLARTTTINKKSITIIDTPGIFDDYDPTEKYYENLAEGLFHGKNGIHALAFVINSKERYTVLQTRAFDMLLALEGLKPYVFILLTKAGENGKDAESTSKYVSGILSHQECPESLKTIIHDTNKRVIMLESIENKEKLYYDQKTGELFAMIKKIMEENNLLMYTNISFKSTALLYDDAKKAQEKRIEELTNELEINKDERSKIQAKLIELQNSNSLHKSELEKKNEVLKALNAQLKHSIEEVQVIHNPETVTKQKITEGLRACSEGSKDGLTLLKKYNEYIMKAKIAGIVVGGAFGGLMGAVFGSIIPGAGTVAGATAGATTGATIGSIIGTSIGSLAMLHKMDMCKMQ